MRTPIRCRTNLAGVQVFVSGIPAPIYGIAFAGGQDQISIQVPYAAPTGPGAAEIQVVDEGTMVADFFTDSFTEDPGIFTYDGNFAIAEASDYSLIGPDNPANPGEPLVLYVTGLGPLNQDLVDGYGCSDQSAACRDGRSVPGCARQREFATCSSQDWRRGSSGCIRSTSTCLMTPPRGTCRSTSRAPTPIAASLSCRFNNHRERADHPKMPSFCEPKFARLGNTVASALSGIPNQEQSVAPY